MSERSDLTRWNRSGLNRFRYIDGNAVEYLEILRQQLHDKFADAEGLCDWLMPTQKTPVNEIEIDDETLIQREERLGRVQTRILESYHQERRDWAWEISRSFARSCHILTEYADAYANEGFLGTTTQWEHVRRLVEMLDYHPAPPASAYTPLVFMAKENKSGLVSRGFQVKNSPPSGGARVVFETLHDLYIDSALNGLRPKGWNQSEAPALPSDSSGDNGAAVEAQYSDVALGPVINIEGIGEVWSVELDDLADATGFKIKDFLKLNLDDAAELSIGEVRLREFKARATVISLFELEPGWSDVTEWLLPRIASTSPELLSEATGKTLDAVTALQLRIELIGAYLDDAVYRKSKLRDLQSPAPTGDEPDGVSTFWQAGSKPQVESGQVAMIYNRTEDKAEAATIAAVDETTGIIDLLPSPAQFSWAAWSKGAAQLNVAPRWKREVWLNGNNVIRTEQAHGLSEGAYISWKQASVWKFAEVLEVDKRHLRLDIKENLPEDGSLLYEAHPLESEVMATSLEAIGLVSGDEPNVEPVVLEELPESIFTMLDPDPSDLSLPPLMPPGSLSFGSFLFPTPMLPMDLVKAAVDMMLNLGVMVIPSTGEIVFKSIPDPGDLPSVDGLFDLLDGKVLWRPDLTTELLQKAALTEMLEVPGDSPTPMFQNILDNLEEKGPLIAVKKEPVVKATVVEMAPRFMVDGSPDKVTTGGWIVGRFTDGLRALKVRTIAETTNQDKSEQFSIGFQYLLGNEGELQQLYTDFRGELAAQGAEINETPIDPEAIELETVPDSLKVGQEILLAGEGEEPVAATIQSIDGDSITTDPTPDGFTKGNLIIYGNVVTVGHGEAKPAKILGSGDATKSNQAFILEVEQLAFTADATKSAGVTAAIDVEIAGRIWQQVSSLKDSGPGDHHYVIRMTEQGFVKVIFGDGEYGRRLPSAKNNIRVRYRVGSGTEGNVAAASLEKPVNPHPLVDTLSQPVMTAGGGDMENLASLRENAPPTLLALERAVSLSDFAHLAAAQSSVWQAKAYNKTHQAGRKQHVCVVIVPASGAESTAINTSIQTYLQNHALPDVSVVVEGFLSQYASFSITIKVKTDEFIPSAVENLVASALAAHFNLENRKLGQSLYVSEVYKIVEAIEGVENSICILDGDSSLQLVSADDQRSLVYLDLENGSMLEVRAEAYQP
ncbi:MAG: hypothetical protein GY820_45655 [Gammaproteobacteria bacterium]|nr:hypothetical protein [Gammaproteobacteria bacterium]